MLFRDGVGNLLVHGRARLAGCQQPHHAVVQAAEVGERWHHVAVDYAASVAAGPAAAATH